MDWDDKISSKDLTRWEDWLQELPKLEQFTVKPCLKPKNFGGIVSTQLHSFADASQEGYGAVTYLRVFNEDGDGYGAFLMGKLHAQSITDDEEFIILYDLFLRVVCSVKPWLPQRQNQFFNS